MAFSAIENKYLSALTAVQFPTEPVEQEMATAPEKPMAPGQRPGDILVAEVGSRGLPQQAYSGKYPDTIKAIEQSTFEKAMQNAGIGLEQAGRFLDSLGQVDVPVLGKISLADFVPFVGTVKDGTRSVLGEAQWQGTPMALQQAGTGQSLTRGTGFARRMTEDASLAAMDVALNAVPVAKAVKAGGKALAPKAAEMTINALERSGMPARGLGIVEQAPQLAVERVPGVKPGDELIVQHNLTANNLLKADKLGGLPVPSLAISKVGAPLENFGEITLIAPREMASPSAKNPVFAADAYTKRFPTIDYQIDNKSQKTLKNLLSDVAEKIPGGDYQVDRLLDNWNDRQYSDILRAKFLDERGTLPNRADFAESWKFDSEVQTLVNDNYSEFTDWLTKFDDSLASNGVNVKERIFQGYTYSGNRRYAEVNLTNLVKEMKGGAGEEGWNYGVSSLRAVATPQFRKFSEIKAARDKIIDTKAMESVKDQTRQAYESLLGRLYDINGKYDAMDALREVVESKNVNSLDRNYDAPPELKADIGLFIQKLKTLPSQYFEIKPQRAVSLEEFKGAIIPKDTPQAAREVLNKAGITDIHEYSTPEERKGLFDKFGKEMFATMPAVPLGSATMQDKEKK